MPYSDGTIGGVPMRTPGGALFAYEEAAAALADALATLPTFVSPQTASAIQATENLWRRIELSGGLLTNFEVTGVLGGLSASFQLIAELRRTGQMFSVRRRGQDVYPEFQFDRNLKNIRPVIPPLLAIAAENGLSTTDLVFWMYSPTTWFGGDGMPVAHLEPADALLDVARKALSERW